MPTVVKGILEVGWVFGLAYQLMPQENEKTCLQNLDKTYLFENKIILCEISSPPPLVKPGEAVWDSFRHLSLSNTSLNQPNLCVH